MESAPGAGLLRRCLLVTLLLAVAAVAGAQVSLQGRLPDLSPDPLARDIAAAVEPLPVDDLIEAAIVFSGASTGDRAAGVQRLQAIVAAFREQATGIAEWRALGARALLFLHENVLRRYDPFAARVDSSLVTGDYNCVSSAVLYLILARSVGLSVRAVRTSDHVLCTIEAGSEQVDVETTNRYGFEPGTRTEFIDTFGAVTGFTYVPPTSYRERHAISEKELLALVLHDRVSLAIDRGDHLGAVAPAMTEWTLAPTELSRGALVTAISNAATSLGMAGRFSDACDFLVRAEAATGPEAALTKRRGELIHNWAVSLAESGNLDAADGLLADLARASFLEPADRASLAAWIVELRAEQPARRGDYRAAADIVAAGLARLGRSAELLRAFEAYSHNVFAREYNAKRYAEARAAVEAALARYPDSALLQQDRDTAAKALR